MTSTIKVNTIQNTCGADIIKESGNTITLGASGDTVTLASGASQTGFGRTGTVDWQTGSIKTSTFTAVNGEGYFCNTSGGAFTVNLPAGSAGAIVSVSDYTRTFQTNNLTVSPNGSEKIGGVAADALLSTEGQSATFVYVDATEGWINTQETSNSVAGNPNIVATGGTITTSGNCKIHTFTGPGTFTVSSAHSCAANNVVSYLVIAGGGGGGSNHGGGGGAGGFREVKAPTTPYTASPLDGYPNAPNRVTVTATAYPITVGAGGAKGPAGCNPGTIGANSIFSTVTSAGGGLGAGQSDGPGGNGGSGGGGTYNPSHNAGGNGNTPPVTPPQGQNGGTGAPQSPPYHGAGGGGAKCGASAYNSSNGKGGDGHPTSITGSGVTYSGGGGAGGTSYGQPAGGAGGAGGGGAGACGSSADTGNPGTANTGGGGGGGYAAPGSDGGNGGSGIVIIRYKFQ